MDYWEYRKDRMPELYINKIEQALREKKLEQGLMLLSFLEWNHTDSDYFNNKRKNRKIIKRLLDLFFSTYDAMGIRKFVSDDIYLTQSLRFPTVEYDFVLLGSTFDFMKIFSDFICSLEYYDKPIDKTSVIKRVRKMLKDEVVVKHYEEILKEEFDDFEQFKEEIIKDMKRRVA